MPDSGNLFYGASSITYQKARELREVLKPAERLLWEAHKNRQ
jgi:hypothetical protein